MVANYLVGVRMRWKPVLGVGIAVVVVLVGVPVAALAVMFGPDKPLEARDLGGVTIVIDSYVGVFVVDVAPGQVALVDAGVDPTGAAVSAALAARGLDAAAVRAIFLTHGHGDHVGACAAFPGAELVAHVDEVGIIEGREATKGPLPKHLMNDGSCHVGRAVTDGEVVRVGDVDFRAFHTPGHTVGSTTWLAREVLFFGDSAGSSRGGDFDGSEWVFSDDLAVNRASLIALSDRIDAEKLTVRHLAFAHSGALEGLGPLTAFAASNR